MRVITSLTLTICIVILSSCTDNTHNVSDSKAMFDTQTVTSKQVLNTVGEFKSAVIPEGSFKADLPGESTPVRFNFESLRRVTMQGNQNGAIVARQVGDSPNQNIRYALGMYLDSDNRVVGALVAKSELIDNKKLAISYFTVGGELIEKITIDNERKTLSFTHGVNTDKQDRNHTIQRCANEILECIDTMYFDLGWGSVSWWVGSALYSPGWLLGTVAGCGYVACFQKENPIPEN